MKYKVGMKITEKLTVSTDKSWRTGIIQYVFNNGEGLIIRKEGSNEDIFIHTNGRDIHIED